MMKFYDHKKMESLWVRAMHRFTITYDNVWSFYLVKSHLMILVRALIGNIWKSRDRSLCSLSLHSASKPFLVSIEGNIGTYNSINNKYSCEYIHMFIQRDVIMIFNCYP